MPVPHEYHHLSRFKERMECQFCAASFNSSGNNVSPVGIVCTADVEEQIFFAAKNFILQDVTITL
jgi:hypothetical protein